MTCFICAKPTCLGECEPRTYTQSELEAAIEATKEKAINACKPFGNTGYVIAAAIRGMK